MDALSVKPEDIQTLDDARRLPLTNKTDLRDNYPFGLFSAPMEEIVRVHASSGTTGKPTTVGYTKNDIDAWAECTARALGCAGGKKKRRGADFLWIWLVHRGPGTALWGRKTRRYGVADTFRGNTQRQIMLMQDFGTSILACTPSYALMLGETMRDMGIDTNKLRLRKGTFWRRTLDGGYAPADRGTDGHRCAGYLRPVRNNGSWRGPSNAKRKSTAFISGRSILGRILDRRHANQCRMERCRRLVITTITKEGMPTLRYPRMTDLHHSRARKHRRGKIGIA